MRQASVSSVPEPSIPWHLTVRAMPVSPHCSTRLQRCRTAPQPSEYGRQHRVYCRVCWIPKHLRMSLSRYSRLLIITLGGAFLMYGCNAPESTDAEVPTGPADTKPEILAKHVVADFLSIPTADVILLSNQKTEFGDSSLDCPEPGISYLQALTSGYRIAAEADGRRFDIRVAGGHAKICHRQKPAKKPSQLPAGSQASALIDLARHDLAEVLQTEIEEVTVMQVRPYNAGTPIQGCTPDCGASKDRCGYMIGLFHDGRRYDYHANQNSVAQCPPLLTM